MSRLLNTFDIFFSARTITAEDNHDEEDEELMRLKQTKSRTSNKGSSRPNSAAMRKNSISSRPNSVALFQHPLYVNLSLIMNHHLPIVVDLRYYRQIQVKN